MIEKFPATEEMANALVDALCSLVMGVSEPMTPAQREAFSLHLAASAGIAERAGQTLTEHVLQAMHRSVSTANRSPPAL
jgi:hypothetical protein